METVPVANNYASQDIHRMAYAPRELRSLANRTEHIYRIMKEMEDRLQVRGGHTAPEPTIEQRLRVWGCSVKEEELD